MLETVEQIEDALMNIIIKHQNELITIHSRINLITNQAQKLLEKKEQELDEKYRGRTDTEQAEKEYLEEYKLIKSLILEGAENTLKKIPESFLNDI